jgi:TolB-like protein
MPKTGHDYFADGMVDELITTLGQVSQLMVAGRTSSFHFRDSDLSPAEISAALGVSHLWKDRYGVRAIVSAFMPI